MFFHQNIKTIRKAWGISQLEMAKKFEVAQGTYSGWENDSVPSLQVIISLANFFKVSIDDLLKKEFTRQTAPERWGRQKEYPKQADETAKQVEEPGIVMSDKVAALMSKVLERMDRLEEEHKRLRQALADKEGI